MIPESSTMDDRYWRWNPEEAANREACEEARADEWEESSPRLRTEALQELITESEIETP